MPESQFTSAGNFSKLLGNEKLSDFTVVSGPMRFVAHKTVLAANSGHFFALFNRGYGESVKNKIQLEDDDPSAIERMLKYMYDVQLCPTPAPKELKDLPYLVDTFIVADKYQVIFVALTALEVAQLKPFYWRLADSICFKHILVLMQLEEYASFSAKHGGFGLEVLRVANTGALNFALVNTCTKCSYSAVCSGSSDYMAAWDRCMERGDVNIKIVRRPATEAPKKAVKRKR